MCLLGYVLNIRKNMFLFMRYLYNLLIKIRL